MHKIALVLACLTCTDHARRVRNSIERWQKSSCATSRKWHKSTAHACINATTSRLEAFSMLFREFELSAAFEAAGPGVSALAGCRQPSLPCRSSPLGRTDNLPPMQHMRMQMSTEKGEQGNTIESAIERKPLMTAAPPPDRLDYIVTNDDDRARPLAGKEVERPTELASLETLSADSARRLADMLPEDSFCAIFQELAPYLAKHRGSIMVVHVPSFLVFGDSNLFDDIMDEISILHLLGVQIVLVVGVKEELDERLSKRGLMSRCSNGIRITDDMTLQILKEISGSARFEIESSLARGFRGRPGQSGVSVVSGNFFYSAKPVGVRDGVDYKFTGEVRRVDKDKLKQRLSQNDVVLLTSLGLSPSGEVFNVNSESVAAVTAASLEADKIIYLVDTGTGLTDTQMNKPILSLRVNQASALLKDWGVPSVSSHTAEFPTVTARYLARSVMACLGGVKRAHMVNPVPGAMLKELYTRDGSGLMICRDAYEGIRTAEPSDLRDIEDLIRPLEAKGILKTRPRESLEKDISQCHLMIRDGSCVACGILKPYNDHMAEVGCLAVHPAYRGSGRGEIMLAYLEREALKMGVSEIFVLSTRTMQWFEERGFDAAPPDRLPSNRGYDRERNSKVYIKKLVSEREVDAEEMLWDVS